VIQPDEIEPAIGSRAQAAKPLSTAWKASMKSEGSRSARSVSRQQNLGIALGQHLLDGIAHPCSEMFTLLTYKTPGTRKSSAIWDFFSGGV